HKRYNYYDNGDSFCCPLIYFRGRDLEILQKESLGIFYYYRSRSLCVTPLRIRVKYSITTNWCLCHAFNY
ncbi:unnamed protein product, partial [Trichobilharzia szidati]